MLEEQLPTNLVQPGASDWGRILVARHPMVMSVAGEETGYAGMRCLHVLLPLAYTGQAQVAVWTGDGGWGAGECFRITFVAILRTLLRRLLQAQCLVWKEGEKRRSWHLIGFATE